MGAGPSPGPSLGRTLTALPGVGVVWGVQADAGVAKCRQERVG